MVENGGAGLEGVTQVSLNARDLPRGVAFYRDVLGLPLLFEVPGAAFFDCGGVRLMLAVSEGDGAGAGTSIVYYRVADLEASAARMRAAGVDEVQPPHRVGRMGEIEVWMCFLRDSEGNLFALTAERRGGGD
jgi:predicted enzyme related to lactoylglutathione lyase